MVGIVKDILFVLFLVSAAIVLTIGWMMTARDRRADLTKNFVTEQTIFRVNPAKFVVTTQRAGQLPVLDSTLQAAFNSCLGTGENLRNPMWTDGNWLAEKSDVFQSAYIAASHNIAALKYAVYETKLNRPAYSFHLVCGQGEGVVIPNAPVVYMSMLERVDGDGFDPAHVWFTGMCLASANYTDKDFVPRNDSIYVDAIYPQVTANQGAALKALKVTGTPEFWIDAAHANGIYGHDSDFANYAAMQEAQIADDLSHRETDAEKWAHGVEVVIGSIVLFIGLIGVWIARRAC